MAYRFGTFACMTLLCTAAFCVGDTIRLKDGTSIDGTSIKFGDSYRVKLADGSVRMILVSDVLSITAAGASLIAAPQPSVKGTPAATGGPGFNAVKQTADNVEAPILAVTIWEKFIDTKPVAADLTAAKLELAKWQDLQKQNAEKINSKWVGGDDRKRLLKDVNELCEQARTQMVGNQKLQAIENYEKAVKKYPNCFEANFALGYIHLEKGAVGSTGRGNNAELLKAIDSLEAAVKLRPNSPAALSNLAVGYNFQKRYELSVLMAYKAAKIEDSKEIVSNLVDCIAYAPKGMQENNKKIKPIIEETVILAQKYGISREGTGSFMYLPPEAPGKGRSSSDDDKGEDAGPPGIIGNGSGFLVSADGYIITNKHVVAEKNRLFRVRFDDGSEKPAEVVAIDDAVDIAVIKIKSDTPLPYLKIASTDTPNPASMCMILGYPVADMLGFHMQVTSGQISAVDDTDKYPITLSANTTHGNSGGPICDRDDNVVGIVSAGVTAYNATYIKALSAGQIRAFLNKFKDKITATFEPGSMSQQTFDGEKIAQDARKATLLVLIIRGDGKESIADIASAAPSTSQPADATRTEK